MTGAERHYTGESGKRYHVEKRAIPPGAVNWVARLRAEKIEPFVRPTDIVFEYGAGFGWNLLFLRCARRIAFDISEHAGSADKAIEWIRTLKEVPGESVNVVICHHALEHLIEPAEALQVMRDLLRPGGRLLLFVPFERESRYRHFDLEELNHHLFSWNAQTLGNLVSECGFRVDSSGIGEFGFDRFAANLATKLRAGESGFQMIRRIAHLLRPASEVRLVATKA